MCKGNGLDILDSLIEYAKGLPVYPSVDWDDPVWDVTEYQKKRGHKNKAWRLKFLQKENHRVALSSRKSFAPRFADFCKCFVKIKQQQRNISFDPHQRTIDSLSILYEVLRCSNAGSDPTNLKKKHFGIAEEVILKEYTQATAYRMGRALQEVADFIDKHRLTKTRIGYHSRIKKPITGDYRDLKGQADGMKKLPSEELLEALAAISNNPLDEAELIRMRIIDLLLVGGFRIGEVLSLPMNCWVEKFQYSDSGEPLVDETTGEPLISYGLRYWPEKGAEPSIKWIPSHAVPLARRAVETLEEKCRPARERAFILEKHPERVPIPSDHHPDDLVTAKELAELVGAKRGGDFVRQLGVKPANLPASSGGITFLYRIRDVEIALVKRRKSMVVVERPGGKIQYLSDSLCVCFFNQCSSTKSTFELIAEPINEQHISDLLGGRETVKSAFDRRGLKASDGSRLKVTTHAFRHWLNTIADHGGLNELQLARWMGRKDVRQNEAYIHGTVLQRVEMAKELIKEGGLAGPVAEVYEGLDPVERDLFLEAHVSTVLFTPFGLCLHDYSIEPCEYHLKCLEGCNDYLRTKGSEREREELENLKEFLERQLDTHRDPSGILNLNDPFCQHTMRQLNGVNAALSIDDQGVNDGEIIKVFPEGISHEK